jgi:hypothetical protein
MKNRQTEAGRAEPTSPSGMGVSPAIKRLVGPMLAGLAIDAVDLMTFGPIGLYAGMLIGGAVGYWLAPELGFPPRGRWLSALMTGIYCTMPITGFIPAATIAAGISRALFREDDAAAAQGDATLRSEGSIEAEYTSEWDDSDRA